MNAFFWQFRHFSYMIHFSLQIWLKDKLFLESLKLRVTYSSIKNKVFELKQPPECVSYCHLQDSMLEPTPSAQFTKCKSPECQNIQKKHGIFKIDNCIHHNFVRIQSKRWKQKMDQHTQILWFTGQFHHSQRTFVFIVLSSSTQFLWLDFKLALC